MDFISLVIGSGRVAVKEVIACVTERLIVAGRANEGRGTATQVTVTRYRRAWTSERRKPINQT